MAQIKNIFWDVDGVLANLNFAYYNFLTKHPNYKDKYGDITWEQLPEVLPIVPKYGALELKTHPTMGKEMDYDFCHSPEFFNNRPLYDGVIEALIDFDKMGFRQFTMSATFDVNVKRKLLESYFKDVPFLNIELVEHEKFMHDTAKEDMLNYCFEKYGIKAEETCLVDDRIYNQHAIMNVGGQPVRYRCEFTTDLPEDMKWIPEVYSLKKFKEWLIDYNKKNA